MKTQFDYQNHKIRITIHQDQDMGPPWKEHDGHGEVSEWTSRDKRPGELLLSSDRSSKRFYDYQGAIVTAKKDGWGLCDEHKNELTTRLGRKPTAKEIIQASVMRDFEYLRGWVNDEWYWLGYTTEIETPDGQTLDGDSCWGFDDEDYMVSEAKSRSEYQIDRLVKTNIETEIASCVP